MTDDLSSEPPASIQGRFRTAHEGEVQRGFSDTESATSALLIADGQPVPARREDQASANMIEGCQHESLEYSDASVDIHSSHDKTSAAEYQIPDDPTESSELLNTLQSGMDCVSNDTGTEYDVGELITPERVHEIALVCRAIDDSRQFVRFIGRTMGDLDLVCESFALRKRPRRNGMARGTDTLSTSMQDARCDDDKCLEFRRRDANATNSYGDHDFDGRSETGTDLRDQGKAEDAKFGAGHFTTEWYDRSAVRMDVAAAQEVWKIVRSIDDESVSAATLNALDSLSQAVMMRAVTRSPTRNFSESRRQRQDRDSREDRQTAADLRALIFILEYPEAQDPDLELVLARLFAATTTLSPERIDALQEFMTGVEAERFERCEQFPTKREPDRTQH